MSIFLSTFSSTLQLISGEFILPRVFNNVPCITFDSEYTHMFTMCCILNDIKYIPKNNIWNNSFAIYANSETREVVITLSSKNSDYGGLEWLTICINESSKNTYKTWDISFDSIIYSNETKTLSDYDWNFIATGQWWYFDQGRMLVGETIKNEPFYCYFELLNLKRQSNINGLFLQSCSIIEQQEVREYPYAIPTKKLMDQWEEEFRKNKLDSIMSVN